MEQTKTPSGKKPLVVAAVAILVLLAIGTGMLWKTSPDRTLDKFLAAVEAGDEKTVDSFIGENLKASKRNNITWFTEDWVVADTIEITRGNEDGLVDEAWRARVNTTTNEAGETVPVINEHDYEDKEIKPTPRWFAHHYEAQVTVVFDEIEDPVVIKLKRKTDNTWGVFSQLFRGWNVTNIKYQPLSEEDYIDLDFEDEALFGDDGEFEFEIDENGEIVAVDPEEEAAVEEEVATDEEATEE